MSVILLDNDDISSIKIIFAFFDDILDSYSRQVHAICQLNKGIWVPFVILYQSMEYTDVDVES
jgi:hypothetical protein